MNKTKRIEELTKKYADDTMTRAEYNEYIFYLKQSSAVEDLDKVLTNYWDGIGIRDDKKRNRKNKPIRSLLSIVGIAASIAIMITATILIFNNNKIEEVTTYATNYGETKEIKLPDGSAVTLNANSKIQWNNNWKDTDFRSVNIEGEAFFDIQHLEDDIPFQVHSKDVLIEVLGTSFNVNSRKNKTTEVYLEEGKVALQLEDSSNYLINMVPGERVKYDAENQRIEKTENETMTTSASWKNGVLNFKSKSFRDVLHELREIYGKSFECNDLELLKKPMYIGVPYADWEAVRQALELSLGVKFVKDGKRYKVERE
ncbi:FecR family protein [Membranihabitans maritimus]|uniref:FecR family protein n=1 Tax=Membranihabitans maritimus TaxID=2904244 RepID=UPI001F299DA0